MKKTILVIIILILTTIVVSANINEDNIIEGNIIITALFPELSGGSSLKPQYEYNLSTEEIKELKTKLNNLPQTKVVVCTTIEYSPVITNKYKSYGFPYHQISFCKNRTLKIIDNNGEIGYYQDINNISLWMAYLRTMHDPYTAPPTYMKLPPNTPYVELARSGLFRSNAVVKQNTELKMFFVTIYSEGTAPIEGTITTPEFVTVGTIGSTYGSAIPKLEDVVIAKTDSFSIPSRSSKSFMIEVDTSEPREIIGDIIIRSNDQNKSEIKIPIHYTITGDEAIPKELVTPKEHANITIDDKVIEQEPDYNKYLIVAIILITILVSLLVIYYKKYK